jgi:hypothetical protein
MNTAITIHHKTSAVFFCLALGLTLGCQSPGPEGNTNNTANGALLGGALGAIAGGIIGNQSHNAAGGAAIGGLFGAATGAAIGHSMDEAQRAWLRDHAPQTLEKIDHNDAAVSQQQQQQQVAQQGSSQPQPQQVAPLTTDDIKALSSAGVKDDVVADEIHKSNSRYSLSDINDMQQAGVSPGILDYIKTNAAS